MYHPFAVTLIPALGASSSSLAGCMQTGFCKNKSSCLDFHCQDWLSSALIKVNSKVYL